MKKKVLSVLLAGVMAVSMFAGCGGNANGTTGSAGTESGSNVASEEGKKSRNASSDNGWIWQLPKCKFCLSK